MQRYFIEVAYKGTRFSGFQGQANANTIQAEIENAISIFQRQPVVLTGSSRTDAGVHALQNYFHFDFAEELHPQFIYKLNALLPGDIAVKALYRMPQEAHSRFDATGRLYNYHIHRFKNPFLNATSFFFPYKLNVDLLQEAAQAVLKETSFFAFSKTNTQVKTFNCKVTRSEWSTRGDQLIYTIEANRFLRGMVRLLTASLLKVGREQWSVAQFQDLFSSGAKAGHSVPAHGLFLVQVQYPANYFPASCKAFTAF